MFSIIIHHEVAVVAIVDACRAVAVLIARLIGGVGACLSRRITPHGSCAPLTRLMSKAETPSICSGEKRIKVILMATL
jgi:hypothetical protein